MKIGAIIQARCSSTRFPNKILQKLPYGSDISVLQQVIRRMKRSKFIDQIIIATSSLPEDQILIKIAQKEGIEGYK